MDPVIASRFYNCIEPEHGEERRFVVERIRTQLTRSIKPGMRVLDIGCGAGRFTFAAAGMGATAVGIDCANTLLEYANKTAKEHNYNASFIRCDYCSLPFAPESFDVALFMCNIVECSYEDVEKILIQLCTIISNGGILCMDMPDYLAQHQQNGRSLMEYDPTTGRKQTINDIPEIGKFPVYSYFWTTAFVKYICSRYMTLFEDEVLDGGRHWFVFKNNL